jgi:hypothetical protein
MKRLVAVGGIALSLLAWSGPMSARQSAQPAKPDMSSITEPSIRGHMEFLASDAMNGRGSGTRDEWLAATYIASNLRRWGIEPLGDDGGYVQAVEVARSEATAPPVLLLGSTKLTHGKEMLVQVMGSPHLAGPLVKFKAGMAVPAGSVVLMPEDWVASPAASGRGTGTSASGNAGTAAGAGARSAGANAGGGRAGAPPASGAASATVAGGRALPEPPPDVPEGAIAMLTIETAPIRLRWDVTGARMPTIAQRLADIETQTASAAAPSSTSASVLAPAPTRIVLSKDAYAQVKAMIEGQTLTFDCALKQNYTWNAIGQLKGSDPAQSGEVILLTAHLDHLGNHATAATPAGTDTIYNGADDDASGTTAVLELAEALSRSPRSKRTVMFAWFGSEEVGGYGAKNFLDHPPVPLDHIIANLEFEMIARRDEKVPEHTLWLTGWERSNLGPELAKQGAKLVADPHPEQNFFARSDNIQLAKKGVVAQTVSSFGLHKDYHQVTDELKLVDFPQMTDAIQSMFAPVIYLLNSTFKPEWNPGGQPKLSPR